MTDSTQKFVFEKKNQNNKKSKIRTICPLKPVDLAL